MTVTVGGGPSEMISIGAKPACLAGGAGPQAAGGSYGALAQVGQSRLPPAFDPNIPAPLKKNRM